MTVQALGRPIHPEMDEDYQKALQYMQSGQWEKAIQLLEMLKERYPQHSELQSLLKQAQLRARLGKKQPGAKRLVLPLQLRPWLRRGLMVALVLSVILAGILAYTRIILPLQQERARIMEQTRLLEEGQRALALGAYDRAAEAFRRLLEQVPDSVPAREGLAIAEERLALAEQYREAVALQEQGRIEEALQAFREIQKKMPGYADVPQRIKALERYKEVRRYYEEATQAYEQGRWGEAAVAYEAVRNLDIDFKQEEVTQRLFECYYHQAQELITQPDETG
ncbi:MAG TPA: tetratricopeptide repeat protein, partial [Caldilineae bacterium]|nr:tetratricopeptide repeat protein [Caldilineae bacterium]